MEMDTLIINSAGLRSNVHPTCTLIGEESVSKQSHHMTELYSMALTTMSIEYILEILEGQKRGIRCLIMKLLLNSKLMEVSAILVDFNYF